MSWYTLTVSLRKTANQWEFESEAALEEFLWQNLHAEFGLTPLKRQYYVQGQICDILAVTDRQQLVILELKNEEDRYVVQQLTRYYDALLEEKPFSDKIDYSQPVQLIAIAPSFHRDNFTDKKHHRLDIEFWQFQVLEEASTFYCQVKHLDADQTWRLPIPFQPIESDRTIPSPPKKLMNLLANSHDAERTAVLNIRKTILGFHEQMQEIPGSNWIHYGKSKTKPCAEIRSAITPVLVRPRFDNSPEFYYKNVIFTQETVVKHETALFLWLSHPTAKGVRRMLIKTIDWQTVHQWDYCPKAFERKGHSYFYSPKQMVEWHEKYNGECEDWEEFSEVKRYKKLFDNPQEADSLPRLVEIALDHWLERL